MKPELNIAMIEDSPTHCQQLQTTLNQWAKEQFVTLHTSVFTDCASCTLDKMLSFDVIFLDIELPDGSGLTLAQSLRNANYLGRISRTCLVLYCQTCHITRDNIRIITGDHTAYG